MYVYNTYIYIYIYICTHTENYTLQVLSIYIYTITHIERGLTCMCIYIYVCIYTYMSMYFFCTPSRPPSRTKTLRQISPGFLLQQALYCRRQYVRVVFPPELSALQPFCILLMSTYEAWVGLSSYKLCCIM